MNEIRIKARWRDESNNWTPNGAKVTSSENLALIKTELEDNGPIMIEHHFYKGGRGSAFALFSSFDDLINYIKTHSSGGDEIYMWSTADVCKSDNRLVTGKVPDEDGCVPEGGSY